MPDTNFSPLDDVGAPLVAASFHQCTLPDTNSSILGLFGASLVAASFHLRAVTDTNSSLHGNVGASVVLTNCSFPNTTASLLHFLYLLLPFTSSADLRKNKLVLQLLPIYCNILLFLLQIYHFILLLFIGIPV